MNEQTKTFGDPNTFALQCTMFPEWDVTELELLINNENILEFQQNNEMRTTRWNLDNLVIWLIDFVNSNCDDPFPFETSKQFAAEKAKEAREFESDDDTLFDNHYDKLYEWESRHCWLESLGQGIIADLYFEKVDGTVEVSWNNDNFLDQSDFSFTHSTGGVRIKKQQFNNIILSFVSFYTNYWYPEKEEPSDEN